MKMKKYFSLLLFLFFAISFQLRGQVTDTVKYQKDPILYTFVINKIPDKCNIPLIGFINEANGNHEGLQLGFVNNTKNDFEGLSLGLSNNVGGKVTGVQIGFFNSVMKLSKRLPIGFFNTHSESFKGVQVGFFNTLGDSANGLQVGFFNTLGDSYQGVQVGFFNTLGKDINGAQVGFINTLGNSSHGLEIGFVNTVGNTANGVQVGLLNSASKLRGLQLGFINRVDTVEKGIPVGFLSFVKKGGFRAWEIGTTEMFPLNISYKTGLKNFYTSLVASYSPSSTNPFAFGVGLGSILPITKIVSFNPELLSQTTFADSWNQIYSIHLNFNYNLTNRFSIVAGPTLVWNNMNDVSEFHKQTFAIYKTELNFRNQLLVGLNVALRYQVGK